MKAELSNSIAAMLPELTALRQDLHQHPELMYAEHRTAGLVAERLHAFGFDEVIEGVGGTGVVGILHGVQGAARDVSSRVLFRADMDALPISEETGAAYISSVSGTMHACGHDGHTAMLLGAARRLADNRNFDGTIVFCFQPAEEGGAGAQAMIDAGMLEQWPVKGAYAVHNWPGLAIGRFGVAPGAVMAGADFLLITIVGQGGHAAIPNSARDPIVAAAHIITLAQTIVSRVVDPFEPAVVSVTSMNGGDAYNVIPDKVSLRCGLRYFNEDVSRIMRLELDRICQKTAEALGVTVTIDEGGMTPYPVTVNHECETAIALKVMREVAGSENVETNLKPTMGSEDFAFILRQVPGAYVFIGNGDSAALHSPSYDFNDEAIAHGVAYWCELAAQVLPIR